MLIVRLCERFGCLPSHLMNEDVDFLRMVHIEALFSKLDEKA